MKLFSTVIGIMLGFVFVLLLFLALQNIVTALSGITGGIGYEFAGQKIWLAYFDSIFYTVFIGFPTLMGLLYYYLANYFLLRDKKKLIFLLAASFGLPIFLALVPFWYGKWSVMILLLVTLVILFGGTCYIITRRFVTSSQPDNKASNLIVENATKSISTIFGILLGFFLVLLFSLLFLSGIVTTVTGLNGDIVYTSFRSQWGLYFASFFFLLLIIVPTFTGFIYNRMAKYFLRQHSRKFIIPFILVAPCICIIVLLWSLKFFLII